MKCILRYQHMTIELIMWREKKCYHKIFRTIWKCISDIPLGTSVRSLGIGIFINTGKWYTDIPESTCNMQVRRFANIQNDTLSLILTRTGVLPVWCQAITRTNADLLPFGTNFSEILIEIHTFYLAAILSRPQYVNEMTNLLGKYWLCSVRSLIY